jgi:hypothetical protein
LKSKIVREVGHTTIIHSSSEICSYSNETTGLFSTLKFATPKFTEEEEKVMGKDRCIYSGIAVIMLNLYESFRR